MLNKIGFPDNTNIYIALDSVQKDILFKPFLESDLKAISFGFDAYFVAQTGKKVLFSDSNNCGHKWDRLFSSVVNSLLIDSKFVTVSKMELGHQESGPRFTTDTTYTLWPENINYFSNDTIKTISLTRTIKVICLSHFLQFTPAPYNRTNNLIPRSRLCFL